MNRGDGTCMHYDVKSSQCTIYDTRPLVCRVDEFYRERFARSISRRVYYLLQADACVKLDPVNIDMPRLVAQQIGDEELPTVLDPQEAANALAQIMDGVHLEFASKGIDGLMD
jgi:Fe-S-cluster containining protein